PCGLIRHLTAEFSHRSIREALGQLGSRKAANRQILNAESVMMPHQVSGQLMEKIPSLVGNTLMDLGDTQFVLGSSLRAFLSPGEDTLSLAELPLSLPEELRGRDWLRAVGERGEILQPQIDPYDLRRIGRRQRNVGHLEFNNQRDVPVALSVPPERSA